MNKEEIDRLMKALQSALNSEEWDVRRDGEQWQIVSRTDERTVQLPVFELREQLEHTEERKEKEEMIQAFASRVVRALPATTLSTHLHENTDKLYPVIRTASFPVAGKDGPRLISREHTAESLVLYVLDFGESYTFVHEGMATEAGMTTEDVHRSALHNVKQLPNEPTIDFVANNRFYFFSGDHYAASRILNDKLLRDMRKKIRGEMVVAIPHQEVLIIGDLSNSSGYHVMGQMALKFYGEGSFPITPLPIAVERELELTPIFVMAGATKHKKK